LSFNVWQIASTSQAWKFTKPDPLSLNTYVEADFDGFLNGVISVPDDGPRGGLTLLCGKKTGFDLYKDHNGFDIYPIASAAVHVWSPRDRHISHASAMLPVRKDDFFFAGFTATSGAPQAKVYWTRVVPVALDPMFAG
jgi:hypothetical protein